MGGPGRPHPQGYDPTEMRVPLTVGDFLDRAAFVYPGRIAVVDEPGVARFPRPHHLRRARGRARGMAGALEAMGVGPGERVAIVSPNSARFLVSLLRGERLRPGPRPGQLPAQRRGGPLHRRALGRDGAARRPGVRRARWPACRPSTASCSTGSRTPSCSPRRRTAHARRGRGAPTRTPPCSINYTSGTTARPKGVQLTHRNCWLNAATFGWHITRRATVTCYLHTLPMFHCNGWGMPYAVTGMGGTSRHAQDRRRGDPRSRRGRRRDAHVRRARGGRRRPRRRRRSPSRRDAVPVTGSVRMVVAGAPPPSQDHRAGRDRARLGVHPDLRADRDLAAADHQPGPGRVGRRSDRAEARPHCSSRAGAPARRRAASGIDERRRGAGPLQPRVRRATGSSRRRRRKALGGRLVPHRRRRRPRRRATSSSPTARRTSSSPGARTCQLDRGRGLPLPAPGGGGGGRDRRSRRQVGRDGQGARRAARPARQADRGGADRVTARAGWPTSSAPRRSSSATELARTATGKLQKFKLRQPYWEGRERLVN